MHIVRALDGAAPALLRYGGHAAAAGFSLDASRFDEFRELISASVGEQNAGIERTRDFAIDCEISGIDVTPELCRALDQLEPSGQGNPAPLLAVRGARVLGTSTFGSEGQHIRVALATGSGIVEAIAFNKPNLADHLPRGRLVDACFGLELDSFQGFAAGPRPSARSATRAGGDAERPARGRGGGRCLRRLDPPGQGREPVAASGRTGPPCVR